MGILDLLQSGAFAAVPNAETLVNALPAEGAQWLQDRALTADTITPTQLSQFGEFYNTLHPDPSQWSGPPPNYLAGLSAGGFELNPNHFGYGNINLNGLTPEQQAQTGDIPWHEYNNLESLQHIRAGEPGYNLNYFRDPRVDAWYAAHSADGASGAGVNQAQMQRMLQDIPDAGAGSPLGGWLEVGPEYERQRIASEAVAAGTATPEQAALVGRRLPPLYAVGSDLPSTNNFWLFNPAYQSPDYSMRNGRTISRALQMQDTQYYPGHYTFGLPPGADYPFGYKNILGAAYPVSSLGWPGQVDYPWYVIDPKVT